LVIRDEEEGMRRRLGIREEVERRRRRRSGIREDGGEGG
jgi:hypothetical protein